MSRWIKNKNGIVIPRNQAGFIQPGISLLSGKKSTPVIPYNIISTSIGLASKISTTSYKMLRTNEEMTSVGAVGVIAGGYGAGLPAFDKANGLIYYSDKGNSSGSINVYNIAANTRTTVPTNITQGFSTETINVDSLGRIYVFTRSAIVNGVSFPAGILRYNADGSQDTSFVINTLPTNAALAKVLSNSDDSFFMSGSFSSIGGVTGPGALIHSDGTIDNQYRKFTSNTSLSPFDIDKDGNLWIAPRSSNIFKYSPSGATLVSLPCNGTCFDIGCSGNYVYVIGDYTSINGVTVANFARLDLSGNVDTTFSTFPLTQTTGGSLVIDCTIQNLDNNGSVCISYNTSTLIYKGYTARYIMKINSDGSVDTSFGTGITFNAKQNLLVSR